MVGRLHEDEIEVGTELVRRLVASQFPAYDNLPIAPLAASGSSNVQYRLGDELLVRLPRLSGGGASIAKECRWLPSIGSQLPVAVPEVVGAGEPEFGYGERWSIVRWQRGAHPHPCSPEEAPAAARRALAVELAGVLAAFRNMEVSPPARSDPELRRHYRGRGLAEYDSQLRKVVAQCRAIDGLKLDLDAALALWERTLTLPGAAAPLPGDEPRWFHGDIVAENLLLEDGRLRALLDFGGLGLGDPTVDLHGAWELLDAPARAELRVRLGVDDASWLRGRAWALAIALMTLPYYWTTMPERIRSRLAMARSLLADPE